MQSNISFLSKFKFLMFGTALILGISAYNFGSRFWSTPLAEWATALMFVNFFAVLSLTNKYYDSVSEAGKLYRL